MESNERKEYLERMSAQLRTWQAGIKTIEAKKDEAQGEDEIKYLELYAELRSKEAEAWSNMHELQILEGDEWEAQRVAAEQAFSGLENLLNSSPSESNDTKDE